VQVTEIIEVNVHITNRYNLFLLVGLSIG